MAKTDHRALTYLEKLKPLDRITVAPTKGREAYLDHSTSLEDLIKSAIENDLFDELTCKTLGELLENVDPENMLEEVGSFLTPEQLEALCTCEDATYTVKDQFGNNYADGSIASGAHSDIDIEIPEPPPFTPPISTLPKPYVNNQQSQKYAGFSGADYYTLPASNHFGNTARFTGMTGGYYDGSNYRDVNGDITTRELAFPDDLILIHSLIGHVDETTMNVACMRAIIEQDALYTDHISFSNDMVYAGIGPNEWFLGSMEWYFHLSKSRWSNRHALSHAPLNLDGRYIITDDEYGLGTAHINMYDMEFNIGSFGSKTSSLRPSIYWCWINVKEL